MENHPFNLIGKSRVNGQFSIDFNSYVKLPESKLNLFYENFVFYIFLKKT